MAFETASFYPEYNQLSWAATQTANRRWSMFDAVPMTTTDKKAEFASRLGSMLSGRDAGALNLSSGFGAFQCSIENFEDFSIIRRDYQATDDRFVVPFSGSDPTLQMIFSLNGQSVFNERSNPYILRPASHSLNFFNYFECKNLLDPGVRQQDITFRLKREFYTDALVGDLTSMNDRLPDMILRQKDFNTINDHLPADNAILGIINNVLHCPYKGEMRRVFIRQHLRALFALQLFHFGEIVVGKEIRPSTRLTRRDEGTLHEVKAFIDQHFLEPSSLESLSKRFGLNEFKLKHGFKKLFNTSTIRYLQNKRLAFSLFLLRETDRSIKDIADEIGYSHPANFTVAFTRAFKRSPQQYRTGKR